MPVEAPEGTAARKRPWAVVTSTSTVGLPRESNICRAFTPVIKVDILAVVEEETLEGLQPSFGFYILILKKKL